MGPLVLFVAGGVAALVSRPYIQNAARKALVSAVKSIEDAQQELERTQKQEVESAGAVSQAGGAKSSG
ncbi:hypothetical protein MYXA107069_26400 [Myxococcus xanthus]|nr:hypothetical protein MyxoNM_06350 [Myxococcus xanthus]SDW40556.1 hypothetical protein SAMN05444383_10238 [Myxococcus xanthus]